MRMDYLEMFGREYVLEHCLITVKQEREQKFQREADRYCTYYLADCLRVITENTAKSVNPGNSAGYIAMTLKDIMDPKPKNEKTGDEIVLDIIKRAGLQCREGGGADAV